MSGGSTRCGWSLAPAFLAIGFLCLAVGPPARALEAFDGRLQAHGFVEMQIRGLAEGYGVNHQELDLAQWYNILNLEVEADLLPDGYGPIDLMSAFVRVEVRYDCIYTHGCGMFPSANTFGNDAQRLPKRLRDAQDEDYAGVIEASEPVNRIRNETPAKVEGLREEESFGQILIIGGVPTPSNYRTGWSYATGFDAGRPRCDPDPLMGACPGEPGSLIGPDINPLTIDPVIKRVGFPGFDTFFDQPGADLIPGTADDPGIYTFGEYANYRFALKDRRGPFGGAGRTQILGPWLPKNTIHPRAVLRARANPFRDRTTRLTYTATQTGQHPQGVPNQRYNTRSTDVFTDPLASLFVIDAGDPPVFTNLVDPFPEELLQYWLLPGEEGFTPPGDFYDVMPKDEDFVGVISTSNLNQRFGGDYSGVIPCQKPTRETANREESFAQRQYSGQIHSAGCIPFTNIRVTGGRGELPMRVAPDRSNLFEQFDPRLASQGRFDPRIAQGLYIPSPGLIRYIDSVDFDNHHFNITESERAWNRGASQEDNKELKEAYVDIEWLDSRLWTRFGLQNIVWGKTELFRTTDQFNPQDLALQTIPGLEESRIALWAARFVYSFYNVGPLEDVRAEFATNLDDFEPVDLGACGEPYTFNVVCSLTTGIYAHGLLGVGVAGVDRPPTFTDNIKGLEVGGRLEWRWDRFSFALTDFYGYNDFPYADAIYFYERSVEAGLADLDTQEFVAGAGRPLADGFTTGCTGEWGMDGDQIWASANRNPKSYASMTQAGIGRDPACLKPGGAAGQLQQNGFTVRRDEVTGEVVFWQVDDFGNPLSSGGPNVADPFIPIPCDPDVMLTNCEPQRYEVGLNEATFNGTLFADGLSPQNALENHTANQQAFAVICSATVTIGASLDPNSCAWTLFGTAGQLDRIVAPIAFSEVMTCILSGEIDRNCLNFVNLVQRNLQGSNASRPTPLTTLNRDANDGVITALSIGVNRADGPLSPTDPLLNVPPVRRFRPALDDMMTLDSTMTNEQRALLGCGPYYGTRCDSSAIDETATFLYGTQVICRFLGSGCTPGGGIDFLNMEASALEQSFVGIEGTDLSDPRYTDDPRYAQWAAGGANFVGTPWESKGIWLTTSGLPQPGTIEFVGGPTCTRFVKELHDTIVLPGCRGANAVLNRATAAADGFIAFQFDDGYDPHIDGCMVGATINGIPVVGRYRDGSPVDLSTCFNASNSKFGFYFQAGPGGIRIPAFSTPVPGAGTLWHRMAGCFADPADAVAGLDCVVSPEGFQVQFDGDVPRDWEADFFSDDINTQSQIFRSEMAAFSYNFQQFLVIASCDKDEDDIVNDPECFNPSDPYAVGKCSWTTPQFCTNVKGFFGAAGVLRSTVRAAGNGRYGRRTFIWHSGGELVLRYQRRNVFGFSMDFGEDATKSNWGVEFTWVDKQNFFNYNDYGNSVTQSDVLNMTISVDRPTFINFLNANRTFFINSQWFFQYITNYKKGFAADGPLNVLFTVAIFTGYFQDRLNPQFVSVYDFNSKSGGLLPSVTYRFTESFSVGVGASYFFGHTQLKDMPERDFAPSANAVGKDANKVGVDNALSNFRDKDEIWLKLRWTF